MPLLLYIILDHKTGILLAELLPNWMSVFLCLDCNILFALSIRSLLDCQKMPEKSSLYTVVFHNFIWFYLETQIQRIQCQIYVEEGIKLIFGPPVKIVQNSNGQRLPLELTLGVIKRVNYHIVPG